MKNYKEKDVLSGHDNDHDKTETIEDLNYEDLEKPNNEVKPVYNGLELLKRNITELPTLLDPIFPSDGVIAIAGSSDIGKSTLLRQFALAVAIGDREFLGWTLNTEHNRAIVVSTEDFANLMSMQLNSFNKERNVDPEKFNNVKFIFDIFNLYETIENNVKAEPIDVLILDAFLDIFDGNNSMNNGGQVRQFLTKYDQLAKKYGFLVIFNHHAGKRTEQLAPSKHNALGSQSFEAKMRLVIEIRQDLISDNKTHLCIVKANYLPRDFKEESFVLESNDNRYFTNTGERELFENLREVAKEKQEVESLVIGLHEEDKSIREITETLRADSIKISKSTVQRIVKKFKTGEK